MDTEKFKLILITTLVGALAGAGASVALDLKERASYDSEKLIQDFYATETAVKVSPHGLRKKMDKGIDDFVLVDTRSPEEYEEAHIVGAVSIHAYTDRYTSAYGEVDRIVEGFRAIKEANPDKDIIVYCYSIPCMTGRKVGNILAQNGIYVKELNIGWNEWRHFWTLWNHEHEWKTTKPEEYIAHGPEPGKPTVRIDREACPIEGEFGC